MHNDLVKIKGLLREALAHLRGASDLIGKHSDEIEAKVSYPMYDAMQHDICSIYDIWCDVKDLAEGGDGNE